MTIRTFCIGRGLWFFFHYEGNILVKLEEHNMQTAVDYETAIDNFETIRPGILEAELARQEFLKQVFLDRVSEITSYNSDIHTKAENFLKSDAKMYDALRSDAAVPYTFGNKTVMPNNRVLDADSYKLSHSGVYPKEVTGMFAYLEARTKADPIVFFGMQMWIMKTLLTPITVEEVDEAVAFAATHGEPFDRTPWDKVLKVYGGFLPLKIRALPEGTVAKSGVPLYTIECTDPDLFWLVSYIETSAQRGIWYPTTIASNDLKNYRICKRYLNESADTLDSLPFMLHDFGARGVSSEETAQIGGAAHLVYFMGSDTISGVRAANWYYNSPMAAFSVPASEHSVQTAYGKIGQERYLGSMLDRYAKKGAIVSIVLDGYDTYREAMTLCSKFKDKIIASEAKVVFRPDSGDPLEVIPRLLEMQAATFGFTVNSKGYKVINNVGIIQGDGISTESMEAILNLITSLGYSAQNIVFGSGGALLQKVNRDTYKFAQKSSAVLVGDSWKGISKSPVTDMGKASKAGRVTATRWKMTGELGYADMSQPLNDEFEDIMQTVYENGKLLITTTLEEVRALARK